MEIVNNIFFVKAGDSDPHAAEKINHIHLVLRRHRVDELIPQMVTNFYVYTDDPTGLDTDFGLQILPLELRDNITDPEFYKLDLMDMREFDSQQNVVIDTSLIPLELCQQDIISSCPHTGEAHELPAYEIMNLTTENKLDIVDNNLPFLQAIKEYWNNDALSTSFLKWYGNDIRELKSKHLENPEYTGTLAEFITEYFTGYIYAPKIGFVAPYHINNEDANDAFTPDVWDPIVREPHFPREFDGMGGEPDDKVFYFSHEWKRINRHVKFLQIEPSETPFFRDFYLRKWVL